uniref:Uncharacterized protein n=1 Tax=Knipowitschia caucasica TaxID=637954 RepID=A0AAV2KKK4_KNICA
MVEVDGSCLKALQVRRVSLVDQLEAHVESLVEDLLNHGVFSRDDREQVLSRAGPRARVRQVLDIIQCKGEESAKVLLFLSNNCFHLGPQTGLGGPSAEYQNIVVKHKDVLKRRSQSMLYYNTRHGEKILFSEHYVNLLLVDGHQGLDLKRHEVLTFGHKRLSLQHMSAFHRKIAPKELLTSGSRSVKKVLVTGVAGIGKTIMVQKILFDFGRSKEHLEFDFIIHMMFRDLNLIDKATNLHDLILRKNRHLAKELHNILANDQKLLFVLDGFDEFKYYKNCDVHCFVTEPDEDAEVVEIFGSLMQGELLPNASVLVTSRPNAINYIPVECIDRFVVISGFSLTEVQDYFSRYFQDKTLSDQMFAIVAANELMLTLCYIPAFCYIVCCILKDNKDLYGEGPKTMTDIYVQYLVAMLRLGDNALDMDTVWIIADVLRKSDIIEDLGIGWTNIGDEELVILSDAIHENPQLKELWMEGNRVSQKGLQLLTDLTPNPLRRIVALWNDLDERDPDSAFSVQESIATSFTDDDMWDGWGEWVLKRCEVSSNDKLLTVLSKVCNISAHRREGQWAKTFNENLNKLIQSRIESCTEEDTCNKLKRFQSVTFENKAG